MGKLQSNFFVKISQNFIKSPFKICLISQISVHNLWHVYLPWNQHNYNKSCSGQHSSPELSIANKTKMFFRAKNKRRNITGLWTNTWLDCDLNLFWRQNHWTMKYRSWWPSLHDPQVNVTKLTEVRPTVCLSCFHNRKVEKTLFKCVLGFDL